MNRKEIIRRLILTLDWGNDIVVGELAKFTFTNLFLRNLTKTEYDKYIEDRELEWGREMKTLMSGLFPDGRGMFQMEQ